eukprot:4939559-Ditylum_brightwellii.AAC.1
MISAWKKVLSVDKRNLEAHVTLGWALLTSSPHAEMGIQMLEASFDSARVTPTIDFRFPQTFVIAATVGRYRAQR